MSIKKLNSQIKIVSHHDGLKKANKLEVENVLA